MKTDFKKSGTEWKPITELRAVEEDISSFGYVKEYIAANELLRKKSLAAIEVKEENGEIFYREKDFHEHKGSPEKFETQYGTFLNHDGGEFDSWLGREDPKDYYVEGNFCDMFDFGEFSYAVSNLQHLLSGWVKIVRIDKNLEATTLYDNFNEDGWNYLQYMGRFSNERGPVLIVTGFKKLERGKNGERNLQDQTILFQIDRDGECNISQTWEIKISDHNSMAAAGDYVYFGQNRMVTRLNITSGELSYLTDKNEEELAELKPMC